MEILRSPIAGSKVNSTSVGAPESRAHVPVQVARDLAHAAAVEPDGVQLGGMIRLVNLGIP